MIAVSLHEIVSRSEFRSGFEWGCVWAALGALVGLASISWFRRPAPIAGFVVAIAFVIGANQSIGLPVNVTRGLLYLAFVGVVAELLGLLWRPLAFGGIVLAIPGASLLTSNTGLPHAHWVRTLVVVAVVVGGTLVGDFDHRYRARGWTVGLYAISVLGVYLAVPDTERALVLLGVSLPLVLLGWPFPLASLGTAGAYPAVGALAWVVAFEGIGRRSAIVGGMACLGLLVVEPLVRLLKLEGPTLFDELPQHAMAAAPVAVAHGVLVVIASRLAGLSATVRQAGVVAVADLVVGFVILLLLDGEVRRVKPGRDRLDR